MLIRVQKTLWIILILPLIGTVQTLQAQTQPTDSAAAIRKIQVVGNGDDCKVCNGRLEKVLLDLEAAEKAIEALKTLITARERLDAINTEIIAKKDGIIKSQADLIQILERQTGRKISFLWGIVKIRY